MRIVIYEEEGDSFYPLVNLMPQSDLHVGMSTISDHARLFFKNPEINVIARPRFGFAPHRPKAPATYLSSRLLLTEGIVMPRSDCLLKVGADIVGFVRATASCPDSAEGIKDALVSIEDSRQVKGIILKSQWDLIAYNEALMNLHFKILRKQGSTTRAAYIEGDRKDLYIARGAKIHKQVFLDVKGGPVYIDRNAVIRPFSTIVGPSYIGPGTIVDRAKVVKSSIGPQCRIGGEVEACIFQGYSNKYHEGFIGHSFIGAWVNIGALTTNSDLKNNYGPVRLRIGDREFDTGQVKLGCFIGDHTKLGIGTLIPTGTVIGSFVNFARGGMMPKYVPDFRWMSTDQDQDYDLNKAIDTARVVMRRRDVEMSVQYEKVIRAFHGQVRRSD